MQTYKPSTEEGVVVMQRTAPASSVIGELPQAVREAAVLRGNHAVIAWTTIDPALVHRVSDQACWSTFGPLMVLPCFWPHLLILFPCLCIGKMNVENTIYSQYWILTERELKVVTMDHATSCCSSSGNKVKSIPLENITDCGVDSVGKGCLNQCYDALPTIYVDTASSNTTAREAVGIGLFDHATFIRQVLDQRDVVKSGGGIGRHLHTMYDVTPATAIATVEPMQRGGAVGGGGGGSVTDRMKQVQELYDAGLITAAEYETKRQDILAGI